MEDIIAHDRGEVTISKKELLKKIQNHLKEGITALHSNNVAQACQWLGQAQVNASYLKKEDFLKRPDFSNDIGNITKQLCANTPLTQATLTAQSDFLQKLEKELSDAIQSKPKSSFWGN